MGAQAIGETLMAARRRKSLARAPFFFYFLFFLKRSSTMRAVRDDRLSTIQTLTSSNNNKCTPPSPALHRPINVFLFFFCVCGFFLFLQQTSWRSFFLISGWPVRLLCHKFWGGEKKKLLLLLLLLLIPGCFPDTQFRENTTAVFHHDAIMAYKKK